MLTRSILALAARSIGIPSTTTGSNKVDVSVEVYTQFLASRLVKLKKLSTDARFARMSTAAWI